MNGVGLITEDVVMEERLEALAECLRSRSSILIDSILARGPNPAMGDFASSYEQIVRDVVDGFLEALPTADGTLPSSDGVERSPLSAKDPFAALGVQLACRTDRTIEGSFVLMILGRLQQAVVQAVIQADWTVTGEHWVQAWLGSVMDRTAEAFRGAWKPPANDRPRTTGKSFDRSLAREESRYRAIFSVLPDPVYRVDIFSRLQEQNRAGAEFLGKGPEELISHLPWLREELASFLASEELSRDYERTLAAVRGPRNCLVQMRRLFGEAGENAGAILILHDYTERVRAEAELRFLSFHDPLTKLFNRAYFQEELVRLNTWRQLPLSLVMGDVNALKMTNDAFGHEAGDRLLVQMAAILRRAFRKEDIIARWGGDEFVIMLPKTSNDVAQRICERIHEACLQSPADPVQPSIALGVATKKDPGQEIEQLLRSAEAAMYAQKLVEAKEARVGLIELMKETLSLSGLETEDHVQTLRRLSLAMGCRLDLSKNQMEELSLLAALHDISQIAVPTEILRKVGRLSDEDWEAIRKHPEIGYRIAGTSPEISAIGELILAHQEHWDGTGYPKGLRGEEIPLLARILSIADAWEAMIRGRPFHQPISREAARAELEQMSGSQFDPALTRLFLQLEGEENSQGVRLVT